MRTIKLQIAVLLEVDVPDDVPLTADAIAQMVNWRVNQYSDGRFPFSAELAHTAAESMANDGVHEALFQHHVAVFGNEMKMMNLRNARIEADRARVYVRQAEGGKITCTASEGDGAVPAESE